MPVLENIIHLKSKELSDLITESSELKNKLSVLKDEKAKNDNEIWRRKQLFTQYSDTLNNHLIKRDELTEQLFKTLIFLKKKLLQIFLIVRLSLNHFKMLWKSFLKQMKVMFQILQL
jgi:hypothetical protein